LFNGFINKKEKRTMNTKTILTIVFSSLLLISAFGPMITIADTEMAPRIHINQGTSTNWSGYAVSSTTGSVTDVKGSWIVPVVTGTTKAWSSFWVGIDGYASNSVEQIGTDSDWKNGKAVYYAWYEFYPQPSYLIKSVPIKAGDMISAEVIGSGTRFRVTITDVTTGKSFSIKATVQAAKKSSAEWIAEAPSSTSGVLPLANFGTVTFSGCQATINGNTGPINYDSWQYDAITMSSSGTTKASPSALSTGGSSFSVTWYHP
jgi:hypothetical protein